MKKGKKTVDIEHLKNLDLAYDEISRVFGVSTATVTSWFKSGIAPIWTLIAAEGLTRRMRGNSSVDSKEIRHRVADRVEAMIDELYKLKIELRENKL